MSEMQCPRFSIRTKLEYLAFLARGGEGPIPKDGKYWYRSMRYCPLCDNVFGDGLKHVCDQEVICTAHYEENPLVEPNFDCKFYDGMCAFFESYCKDLRKSEINPCKVAGECVGVSMKSDNPEIQRLIDAD